MILTDNMDFLTILVLNVYVGIHNNKIIYFQIIHQNTRVILLYIFNILRDLYTIAIIDYLF